LYASSNGHPVRQHQDPSLGVQKCDTIVAVGAAPIAALDQGRAQFPGVRYITVGGAGADVDATSAQIIRAGLARRLG
jgi:hypothetical protein